MLKCQIDTSMAYIQNLRQEHFGNTWNSEILWNSWPKKGTKPYF